MQKNFALKHLVIKIVFVISTLAISLMELSAGEYKTNYSIMNELSEKFADSLFTTLNLDNVNGIKLEIEDTSNSGLILRNTSNKFIELNINSETKNDSNFLKIKVLRYEVKYSLIDDSPDSLKRSIFLDIYSNSNLISKNGFKNHQISFHDTIYTNDIELIESKNLPYTRASIPTKEKSFFKQIVEPAILVSTAILTVIILFTVRSN